MRYIIIGHLLGVFMAVSSLALLLSGFFAAGCYVFVVAAFHSYEMRHSA